MLTDEHGNPLSSEKPPEEAAEPAVADVAEEELEEGIVDVRFVTSGMLYYNMFRQMIEMDRMEMIMGQIKMEMHQQKAIVPPPHLSQFEEKHAILMETVQRMVREIDIRYKPVDERRASIARDEMEAAKE